MNSARQDESDAGEVRAGQVVALKRLPHGPKYWLHELARKPAPVHSFRVGTGAYCDLVVADGDGVAEMHCYLEWTSSGVLVRDYRHSSKTQVNKVVIVDGHAELHAGSVLTLGNAHFMACGRKEGEKPEIVARDTPDMLREGLQLHGTKGKLADAIDEPARKRTIYRRLTELGIAAAVLLGAVHWSGSGSDSGDESPAAVEVRPAAAVPRATAPAATAEPAPVSPMPAAVEKVLTPAPESAADQAVADERPVRRSKKARKRRARAAKATPRKPVVPDARDRDEDPEPKPSRISQDIKRQSGRISSDIGPEGRRPRGGER